MRAVTGQPIKFVGVGEKLDQFESFQPQRIAGRILDMGDIVSLVERAACLGEQEENERLTKKMQKGTFDLNDMAKQIESMMKMGGMSSLLGMLPGMGRMKDQLDKAGIDDRILKRQIGIIRSMTQKERKDPNILNGSRRRRIAKGAGSTVQEVNRLIKQFEQTQHMMKKFTKVGEKGLIRTGLKGIFGRK
jgi:signal recognition particle subunit SRP54